MEGRQRMYFLTPMFEPVGGVVKVFDYVNHAIALGYEPIICCPDRYREGLPLFTNPRFSNLTPEGGIKYIDLEQVSLGPDDLAFLTWPSHYEVVERRMSRWTQHEQVIQIVQNVRWANPAFNEGYAVRVLSRPMARIMTNEVVLEAVKPYLNETSLTEVIQLGNDSAFFAKSRTGSFGTSLKVAYTTWKSDVGDHVASLLAGSEFQFRVIRHPAGWDELRKLYHWADVFLATPFAEEGFYMPGLEAMAAGAVVLTPDAGGNRAYCDFGKNCIPVGLDDAGSYVAALKALKAENPDEVDRLRSEGYETVKRHTLENERERFGEFMERLKGRLRKLGPEVRSPRKSRDV